MSARSNPNPRSGTICGPNRSTMPSRASHARVGVAGTKLNRVSTGLASTRPAVSFSVPGATANE